MNAANFFIHVPRLNGKGDILAVQSSNVQLQTVEVLVDRVKDRVVRKPAEYGTVVNAVEIRFEDDSEPIEFEEESSLELLNYQLSPSGEVRRDAKAWPQVWAIMEMPSGEGQGEPLNKDQTIGASFGGHGNRKSQPNLPRPPSPKLCWASAPKTPARGRSEREKEQQAKPSNSPNRSQGRQLDSSRPVSTNQEPPTNLDPTPNTPARGVNSQAQSAGRNREHITATVLDFGDEEPDQNAAKHSDAQEKGTSRNSQGGGNDLPDFDEGLVSDEEERMRGEGELRDETAAGVEREPKKRGRKPGPVAGKKRKLDAEESSKSAKRPAIDRGEKGGKSSKSAKRPAIDKHDNEKKGGKQSAKEKEKARTEELQRPSRRQAPVFGSTPAQGSYRAASKGKQAATSASAQVDGRNADAGIDKAHYKKIVGGAGCSKQVSSMTTICANKAPCKTLLFRIEKGKEVRKGKFDSIYDAVHAAKEGDIIEQWGMANEAWFNLYKRVTLRGHPNHPAILCDKWSVYPVQGDCEFKPFIEVQASASGLQLGPNVLIKCSTDKGEPKQTAAVYVRNGAKDIVFDHVTIRGNSLQPNKKPKEPTERPGGFGIILAENTSAEMRHCRVLFHELPGIQARRGAKLELRDCNVSSNGDDGIWGFGSSKLDLTDCTIGENGQVGVCIDGLPSRISGCLIRNNHLDGLWLDWPNKTRVEGLDQDKAKERVCKEAHVIDSNYITGNDHGIVVEEGVAIRSDCNVFEGNRDAGVYFDEVGPEKQIDYPCQLEGCRSTILRNNIYGEHPGDKLVHDKKRRLPKVDMDV